MEICFKHEAHETGLYTAFRRIQIFMILESVYIFICQFQIRPTKNSVIFLIMNVAFLLFNVYNLFVIPIKSLNNCANSIWLETFEGNSAEVKEFYVSGNPSLEIKRKLDILKRKKPQFIYLPKEVGIAS